MATNEEIALMVGNVQGDVRNISESVKGIKDFVLKQSEQYGKISEKLAVIDSKQDSMKQGMDGYTVDCTAERKNFDKRLTAVEGFQSRQLKTATFVGSVAAFITTVVVEYIKH